MAYRKLSKENFFFCYTFPLLLMSFVTLRRQLKTVSSRFIIIWIKNEERSSLSFFFFFLLFLFWCHPLQLRPLNFSLFSGLNSNEFPKASSESLEEKGRLLLFMVTVEVKLFMILKLIIYSLRFRFLNSFYKTI